MKSDTPENNRFVKVRLKGKNDHEQYMTFIDGQGDNTPPRENPIIESIREKDPEQADKLLALLIYMKEHESEFFNWLESSPNNSLLFTTDPVTALKTVFPNAPVSYNIQ